MHLIVSKKSMTLGEMVYKIDSFNRAWKISVMRFGSDSALSMALRDRKTDLQLKLLSDFPTESSLVSDNNDFEEPQYSISLVPPAKLPHGGLRGDANHIPDRIAERFVRTNESNNTE